MGQAKIGGKIVLEGEKEYREALKGIASEQKELRSEMKLCSETFSDSKNSVEALEEKYEILGKQYETQAKKVEIYAKALDESNAKKEETKKKVEGLSDQFEEAKKALEEMADTTDVSSEALKEQSQKVEELKKTLSLAEEEYDSVSNKTTQWQTSLNYANADLKIMGREIEKTSDYLDEAKTSVDGCAKGIDKFGKELKDTGEAADSFSNKSQEAINGLASVLAATGIVKGVKEIAEELVECTEKSREFGVVIAKVGTVADTTNISLTEIKEELLELSSDIGIAVNGLSDATYNAISASVETEHAVQFAGNSTKLAIGGFTDTTTSVDILTTAINAYNLETEDSIIISDMLINTQNEGKTTVADLAINMGKVIPVAKANGVEFANLSTNYAIMTSRGIASAEATTYMKAMFNELGDSGSAVGAILEEVTGKSFSELGKEGKSVGDIIAILGETVNNNESQFNQLWSSSEAGVGALAVLGAGAEEFNEILDSMKNSAGATEEAFAKMTDTTEYAKEKMVVSFDNMKIAIGDELNPTLEEFYNTGTDVSSWMAEFVRENPEMVSAITALVAGIAVLTVGISAAAVATVALNAALTFLKANPMVLLVSAIAAATVALETFIAIESDANAETKQMTREFRDLREEIKESKNSYDEITKSISGQSVSNQTLISTLKNLMELEVKDATTKAQINDLVIQANENIEELNLSYDEQSDKISMTTDKIEKYVEAMGGQGQHQEDVERMNELLLEQAKLQESLAEATEYAATTTERSTSALFAPLTVMEFTEALAENKAEYEALEEKCENYTDALETNKEALKETRDYNFEYGGSTYVVKNATEETIASINELQTAYIEAKEEAHNSITSQVGLFEELKMQSDLTTEQMTKNLGSQTEYYNQYAEDLEIASSLMKDGANENFSKVLESIMDMGVGGAGYLHELVAAAQEDSESFSEVLAEFGEMETARENLEETIAAMTSGCEDGFEELIGVQTEKINEYAEVYSDKFTEINENTTTLQTEMVEITTKGVADVAKAIETGTPKLVTNAEIMCDKVSAGIETKFGLKEGVYVVFSEMGEKIDTSIAAGIISGSHYIEDAMQKAVNEAIDNIDFSKFEERVNKALGAALG